MTNLQLSDNDCSGVLPAMELIRLKYITRVALNGNQMGGYIPDEMGHVKRRRKVNRAWATFLVSSAHPHARPHGMGMWRIARAGEQTLSHCPSPVDR